jgi:hypothetical protein
MKTFVLALALLAPDGTKTELPLELWHFDSMAECVKSSTFMNKGAVATAKSYSCVEYNPSMNVAKVTPQSPARKRNS